MASEPENLKTAFQITRLLPYIPAWLLPHLAPALAVFGDNFLRIDPGRADEAALAVYCRFLQVR